MKKVLKKIGNFYDNLLGNIFLNHLLIIVYESVFHFSMVIILFYQRESEQEDGQITTTQIVSTIILYLLIVLMVLLLWLAFRIMRVDGSWLRLDEINDRIGFLYEGIDLRFMHKRSFVIIYILRRVAMALLFGLMQSWSGITL